MVENSPTSQYIPKKLHTDAIVEAVCQIYFNSPYLPEIIVGRLSDIESITDFTINRLPAANIPNEIRNSDPNFMYQPTMELIHKQKTHLIRFSEKVVSYHITGLESYVGWEAFRIELLKTFRVLFEKINVTDVFNISFRYINALSAAKHHISDMHDLNFEAIVKNEPLNCPVNLNFVIQNDETHATTTRIAHRHFVQGSLPELTTVIVDVEVNTPPSKFKVSKLDEVMSWIDDAHTYGKEAFFKLIPDEAIKKLEEK